VKVRGFRIELGEIEAVLARDARLRQAVATVREDRRGDKRIVAYVVSADTDVRIDATALLARARDFLPDFMMPSAVVQLPSLPLMPNGKLDRTALPAPDLGATTIGRPPRTGHEAELCRIFAEVLGLPEVGATDGFFALGGHSLILAHLASQVRKQWGVDLPSASSFSGLPRRASPCTSKSRKQAQACRTSSTSPPWAVRRGPRPSTQKGSVREPP